MEYLVNAFIVAIESIFEFDSELYFVVFTSLKISFASVLIASTFCIPLGLFIASRKFKGKNFLQSVLNTFMAMPTVVVGLLLYGFLSRNGPFGGLELLYTPIAMIIGQCLLISPVILNLAVVAASSADPRIRLSSIALGANDYQQYIIFVKEIRFALVAAIVMGFGRAIGEIGIAMIVGGNIEGYTRTMTTAIALETSKGDFEFAMALGLLLILIAFTVNFFLQRLQQISK